MARGVVDAEARRIAEDAERAHFFHSSLGGFTTEDAEHAETILVRDRALLSVLCVLCGSNAEH
jgi:hypothetical protein